MKISSECSSKPMIERDDDYINDDDDDDTLSFCDLPIYSSSGSNSFTSMNQYKEEANAVFEFFSGELDTSDCSAFQENDDIIFCGKLIGRNDVNDRKIITNKVKKQGVLFSWKRLKIASFSLRKFKSRSESDSSVKVSSATKVSTLMTSPTKSRWYLFLFGQTRFPQAMTMDLSDLKNRQRRSLCSPSTSMIHRAAEGGGTGIDNGSGSSRGRRGIWSLLKESVTTSVAKTDVNDVVRAVNCISLL